MNMAETTTGGMTDGTAGAPAGAPTRKSVESLPFKQFVWGAGIECSFLPHLDVNQFQWTQHDRFWRDDLRLAREELGMTHLRYALPWHVIEAKRGQFDWTYADERIEEFKCLGIEPFLDVMHFGTPLWLRQAVGDPEFPEALERFTTELVGRYRGSVRTWCPFNEPLVSALFSGDLGFWPPHSRKWRGYMPVLSRIAQAVSRGIRAIRRTMPEANVLLCDAAENYKTRTPELQAETQRRNLRRFIIMDLLLGRVDKHHPLFSWLTAYGFSEIDLEWFRQNPQAPDILGLDYYPHSDWALDKVGNSIRQRRADSPVGLYGVASAYWKRYGIPMILTETSVEGQPVNREIWLEANVDDVARLRGEGIPLLGLMWWPMLDQIDWDGALTHRIGKVHEVGLFALKRRPDGTLARQKTPLVEMFRALVEGGEQRVGKLEYVDFPSTEAEDEQLPPIGEWVQPTTPGQIPAALRSPGGNGNGNGQGKNGNGAATTINRMTESVAGLSAEPAAVSAAERITGAASEFETVEPKDTDRYGIVVFSHLRWGFVWQRPQQFLSRFAKKHPILFVEEPMFDRRDGSEPDVQLHRVMPNVTVACPHCPASWNRNPQLPDLLRRWTRDAISAMNESTDGAFDRPLLWYYSPMDAGWSLGHFDNRGVVYDCMDELSQFTGAPRQLVDNEARLLRCADIVFTGGYNLGEKKRRQHDNVHVFGCGVEFEHFNQAANSDAIIPPDIDFMARPILGWFGVVDERVDYAMVGEMARERPDWSFAMVGPVVKVDPNLLPHSPNLYWLGARDYQQLPAFVAAFDICMMCFALNAATEYINPTKGLEYMATGKPVISTHVRDVVRQWSDIVYLASGTREFIAAAERALDRNDPDRNARVQRGLELARRCSWEGTVKSMQTLIREAIGRKDRRSARRIEPLSAVELSYLYQPTPGS